MPQMNLCDMRDGQEATVTEILGGRGIRQRLASLGVHPGDKVAVIRGTRMMGPVLIRIHGTEVAIGYGMAHKIKVA